MQGELFCFEEVVFGGGVGWRGILFLRSVWGDEGGGVFLDGQQAGPGLDYLRFLFGNQRLSVWFDVSGNRHLTADCRFLCGQKAAEKPAPDARHSTRQQSRQICLWHNICVVVVTRQSQRLPSLLRLASVAPERFCGASQLLRNLRFLVSPARFLRGGHGSRGLRAP